MKQANRKTKKKATKKPVKAGMAPVAMKKMKTTAVLAPVKGSILPEGFCEKAPMMKL